jgi:hypothetical protein
MADKPIYVEFDYENIFLVDPNSVTTDDGGREDRYVKQESLIMYANLECKLSPRSKLTYGVANGQVGSETVTIGKINFLKPNDKDFLENNYLGELLGTDEKVNAARSKNYAQQSREFFNFDDNITNNNSIIDNGFLGITNIQVRTNSAFVPTVTITLVDVRGRAMFEQGNNSPYAAFFSLPYPIFYLTLKGYYGKAVQYPLLLQKFNSSYDSSSGNFIVSLTFITYKYGPFGDITMGEIMALPHMYTTKFTTTSQTNNSNSSDSRVVETQTSQRGYQRLVELYDKYRNSDPPLITDLPNITIQELMYKLDKFVQDILNNSGKVDLQPLTNCDLFLTNLEKFQGDVYFYRGESWFDKYINTINFYISKTDGKKYYTFKEDKELDQQTKIDSIAELKKIIVQYNDSLAKCNIGLTSDVDISNFLVSLSPDEVDPVATYKARNNKAPTPDELTGFTQSLNQLVKGAVTINSDGTNFQTNQFFIFEGVPNDETFITKTSNLKKRAIEIREENEKKFSEELVKILENPQTGIGFKPTIRNIISIFVVSVEAFYSLLDDVHTKAYDKRYDKARKSEFTENDYNCLETSQTIDEAVVYPWPLFTVKKNNTSGDTSYEIAYPGDRKYQNVVKSYDYSVWPEVEFVEEFANAFAQRESVPNPYTSNRNENKDVYRLSLSTFDAPIKNIIFSNKEITKFLYEIIERIILNTNYQGLQRDTAKKTQIINFISDAISKSIKESIGTGSPDLLNLFSNYKIDVASFNEFLKTISNNGNGESYNKYIRDYFVTQEIEKIIQTPTIIYKDFLTEFPKPNLDFKNVEQLFGIYTGTTSNTYYFFDTLPYISDNWLSSNVTNGKTITNYELFNNTTKSIMFNPYYKTTTNFESFTNVDVNRPVTNFNVRASQQINTNNFSNEFYTNLLTDNTQLLTTVGSVYYSSYNNLMTQAQCTSIFNTPFFVNAIQNGVNNEKSGAPYPYTEAAYLLLNSLPLATLSQRFKDYQPNNGNSTPNKNFTELDYIASTFRKFGALHKIPYAWILKYGSIWYRYKNYVNNNIDILDKCWVPFNYQTNYDPINSDISRNYQITSTTTNFDITLKKVDTTSIPNITYEDVSVGFYPKVINDFNYFYNGFDLVTQYSTVSQSFSYYRNDGTLKILSPISTKISSSESTYDPALYLTISNYSCLLKNTLKNDDTFYVTPSFGSPVNQLFYEFFNSQTNDLQKNYDVPGTYNGSIRLDWSNPHFGYFDPTNMVKPSYNEYLCKINSETDNQQEFTFLHQNGYSKIEDIFGVFTKEELDIFEKEFLNFSKSEKNYNEETANKNMISEYNNFQMLYKIINKVNSVSGLDDLSIIKNVQQSQFSNKNQTISQFLNKDVVLKRANPYDYNRKTFLSFLSTPTQQLTVDPINFGSYQVSTPNAVPIPNNNVTTSSSKIAYPNEWKTLQEYVGFSTFEGINYAESGSTITDFFPVFDIPFTSNNIILLSPIIKLYSSYKYKTPNGNREGFLTELTLDNALKLDLTNNVLNNTLLILQKELPKIQIESIKTNSTNVIGEDLKVEYYDMFKVLNDKWVSGNNFSEDTFLESFLFLDKASRDIGDDVLVDIFKVKTKISNVDPATSVYTVIAEILKDHHFVTFTMPSYINFYNRRNNEGPQEMAQLMFGTYSEVDYSETSTKFVNILSTDPSTNTLVESKHNGYCDDGFELGRSQNNPNVRLNTSTDERSNKVVGFSVDFGIQRQQMFHNLNLAQDVGKSTSESLLMEYNLAQLTSGKKSQTQNVSLFNLYKNRSYSCTVQSMGNATIQPTMYFTLRNVPMFNGPYLILEVNHSISPGSFETTFQGVRQKIFTLKQSENFLASIKMELGKNFYSEIKRQKEQLSKSATTVTQQNTETTNSINETPVNKNNENCQPNEAYNDFIKITGESKTLSYSRVIEEVGFIVGNDLQKRAALFTLIYISNDSNGNIKLFNNNLTNVNLKRKWAGDLPSKFNKEYTCLNFGTELIPIVKFPNITYNLEFMNLYLKNFYPDLNFATDVTIVEELTKFYIKYWSLQSKQEDAYYDEYISKNAGEYATILEKVKKAYVILNPVNLNPAPTGGTQTNTGTTLTNNIQTPPLTSDYQYTISNPPMFEELTVSVNPSVDGLRNIFLVEYGYNITASCAEGSATGQQFSNNYISSNGQTVTITAEDLLEEVDCTGSGSSGVYEFQITIFTKPVLSNGQIDTTRSDYYKSYPITMTF